MSLEDKVKAVKQMPLSHLVVSFEGVVSLLEEKEITPAEINIEDFTLLRKELQRRQIVSFH